MIFFINGASSSGKTALARALQSRWTTPLIYCSLDSVIAQLPFHYTGTGVLAREGFPLHQTSNGQTEITLGPVGYQINTLAAQYVASIATAGFDTVVDMVLLNTDMFEAYRQTLKQLPICFIGLYCDDAELLKRQERRKDRAAGLATTQNQTVHFCKADYQMSLDSTNFTAEALAEQVISYLDKHTPVIGFPNDSRGLPNNEIGG